MPSRSERLADKVYFNVSLSTAEPDPVSFLLETIEHHCSVYAAGIQHANYFRNIETAQLVLQWEYFSSS